MKKLVILVRLMMFVAVATGCNDTAKHSVRRNCDYLGDDLVRAFGLDQPSCLHARDNVPWDAYEPYRSYD